MLKKWLIVLLCLIAIMAFSGCNRDNEDLDNSTEGPEVGQDKLKVTVTFDAMKEFVQAIGGDKVDISVIIPKGSDAHTFEPRAQDLINISKAHIFVYNGLGMEGWVDEIIHAGGGPDLVIVDSSKGAHLIKIVEDEGNDHHGHSHGKYDPHLWLGLRTAQSQVENITHALIQVDPSNQDYYKDNYKNFHSQLENLYKEYTIKFEGLEKRTFVTGHAAFGYLCRDFNLQQSSIRDIFAEGEPSAKQLSQLVEFCKENNIRTIFTEEMVSPEVSKTLANEVGAKVEIIYTIENAYDNMTYLERMESNLSKIYKSLTN